MLLNERMLILYVVEYFACGKIYPINNTTSSGHATLLLALSLASKPRGRG